MTWIQSYTGKKVNIPPESPSEICLTDIAHHLSMKCRFNGACSQFLSVAQHSTMMLNAATGTHLRVSQSDNFLKWVLLHDAHEAYIGDTPRPIKKEMLLYLWGNGLCDEKELTNEFDVAIAEKFGLEPLSENEVSDLDFLDNVMLATEARDTMSKAPAPWEELPAPLPYIVEAMSPTDAKQSFKAVAKTLGIHD